MQNVVNLHCPFLFHGEPIVEGRVYFVKPSTTATTYNSIAGLDNADFVPVYDKSGTLLPNPLSLDSDGNFSTQPFVDDATDYKMIVCRRTGINPELNDETQAWEVAYTMDSKTQSVTINHTGVAKVDSVVALRSQNPSEGSSVLVLGYAKKNDFCPPRIFTFRQDVLSDNGGTHIRSFLPQYQYGGTWVCEPEGFVDVRWFGVGPGTDSSNDDCWAVVNNIVSTYYPDLPIYFPKGFYRLSDNLTVNSAMILDKGTRIRPHSQNITVTINRLENRGGIFQRARLTGGDTYYNVYPKVKGEFRSSWVNSPADQITADMLANVDLLVFDTDASLGSGLTISKKKVLIKDGKSVTGVFYDKCEIFYESTGVQESKILKTSDIDFYGIAEMLTNTPSQGVHGILLKAMKNNSLDTLLRLFFGGSELFSSLKLPALLVGDEENGLQNGVYVGDAESPWPGILALYANAASLKNILAESLAVHGTMSHAKSSRSKVLLKVYRDANDALKMNVNKDGVDWGDINPATNTTSFNLSHVTKDDVLLFAVARDFDILVTTTISFTKEDSSQLSIILPSDYADEEKIFSVCYAPMIDSLGTDEPLKLSKAVAGTPPTTEEIKYEGQDSQYETGVATYDNSFFGTMVVRKEVDGDWFFDPFTI